MLARYLISTVETDKLLNTTFLKILLENLLG